MSATTQKFLALKPVITEKSMRLAAQHTYLFDVPTSANKLEIARAVEKAFSVKVEKVRVSILKGKVKQFRGHSGVRANKKRAYVVIKEGQKIAAFEVQEESK